MQSEIIKPKSPFPGIVVIGCGGVGSYMLPTLLRTVRDHANPAASPSVILYDGDTLETRNMERQLFGDSDVGKNKAEALLERNIGYYPNLKSKPEFFTGGEEFPAGTILISCVDNHPGRKRVLECCDRNGNMAILCGNGYTDAEAMFYRPAWKGLPTDPRVKFPEIETAEGGDPLAPEGCTGAAQAAAPQLAVANFMAAAYGLHLLWFWTQEFKALAEAGGADFAPVLHSNNFTKAQTRNKSEYESDAIRSHQA
jgi:hypothetical protein